ncbi:MAG TPA: M20/M25/M40 family metallo-hydrolase [Pyrinomonadaceae bacterium]|nr:M20/M25/M40 family metallo-hydrolase [Pyrinomonadaceae bacterium]HMP66415.1 M20/M25/M40 family metallo-hydrolase [Pyrinomonadaceae bacterium]
MFKRERVVFLLIVSLLVPGAAFAHPGSAVENAAVDRIRDEGMNRSQAMATMHYLSDVIGARLTNSPAQRRANQWTKEQLEKWGMKNAAIDPWGEFGRGWELKRFKSTVKIGEEFVAFRTYPKAWSPSTNGAITGDVVYVDATDEAGLEKYKGKLKGAIVLMAPERAVRPNFEPLASRVSDEELAKLEEARPQDNVQQNRGRTAATAGGNQGAMQFNQRKNRFYFEEGAAVLVEPSMGTDSGTIRVMGAMAAPIQPGQQAGPGGPFGGMRVYSKDAAPTIPQLVAETEQYNRIYRLVKAGIPVKMTVDIEAQFFDDDLQGYNTIAEIPGTDLADEVVMIGGHLDSWHAGNGSTDNGAGVTVAMEAMRILAATGLKPRRTIRVALWTGEEQGLLGSRGYVAKNFAELEPAAPGTPASQRKLIKKPAFDKFSAYYNLDNGTGQIRGINMQGNEQLRPIFRGWFEPFHEIGAATVSANSVGGTDHLAFDGVGLPGFQFIQDPIEYFGRTWHTTQDVADRTIEEDLKRSAVIMATFAYNTAMMDERLPRKSGPDAAFASFMSNYDLLALSEEAGFRSLGLGSQICGFHLTPEELPYGFPAFLTLSTNVNDYSLQHAE